MMPIHFSPSKLLDFFYCRSSQDIDEDSNSTKRVPFPLSAPPTTMLSQDACTDLFLKSDADADKKVLMTMRTLDYPTPILSRCVKVPRGENRTTSAPDGSNGLSWISQYGFIGLTAFGNENDDNNIIEGLNEKGLKLSALTLMGSEYPGVPPDQMDKAMALTDCFGWLLGSCATVKEVKEALKSVCVWGNAPFPMTTPPGLHLSAHDGNGDSLVVEFVNGEVRFHENPVNTLTNDPTFDQQLANLQNYKELSNGFQPGEYPGTGLIPLLGDYTTTSRFVRGATLLKFAKVSHETRYQTALEILGAFVIPKGVKLAKTDSATDYDYTRWKTITDLVSLTLSFSACADLNWYSVDLKCVDFSPGTGRIAIPIEKPKGDYQKERTWDVPVTNQFNPGASSWSRLSRLFA